MIIICIKFTGLFFDLGSSRNSFPIFLLFSHIDSISTINEFINILKDKDYIIEYMSNFYANKSIINIEETFLLEVEAKTQASLLAVINNYEIVLDKLIYDIQEVNVFVRRYYKDNFRKVKDCENLTEYMKIVEEHGGEISEIEYIWI